MKSTVHKLQVVSYQKNLELFTMIKINKVSQTFNLFYLDIPSGLGTYAQLVLLVLSLPPPPHRLHCLLHLTRGLLLYDGAEKWLKYKALFLPNAKLNQYNDFQRDLSVDGNLHEEHIKNQWEEDFNMWLIVWKIPRIEVKRKFNQNTFQIEFIQMKKKEGKVQTKELEQH